MYSAAGICAEQKALDAELRYLRASKVNQVTEAQDARIEQKRWLHWLHNVSTRVISYSRPVMRKI